jgi:hypothetical protein
MGGGLEIASRLPEGPAAQLAAIVKESFVDGLTRGSLVSAVVVLVGAVVSWRFLPARTRDEAVSVAAR